MEQKIVLFSSFAMRSVLMHSFYISILTVSNIIWLLSGWAHNKLIFNTALLYANTYYYAIISTKCMEPFSQADELKVALFSLLVHWYNCPCNLAGWQGKNTVKITSYWPSSNRNLDRPKLPRTKDQSSYWGRFIFALEFPI